MTEKYLNQLTGDRHSAFPILGEGTTESDYKDAMWVLGRQKQMNPKTTTWKDLQLKHANIDPKTIGMDNVNYDDLPLSQLSHGMHKVVKETKTSTEIKKTSCGGGTEEKEYL